MNKRDTVTKDPKINNKSKKVPLNNRCREIQWSMMMMKIKSGHEKEVKV